MEKKLRVLVADDDEVLAIKLQSIIAGNSNVEKVKIEKNGRDEFLRILEFEPDIVFTDMQMPIMTGLAVIKKIKESQLEKEPQFILVTSDRSADLIVAARELKFDIEYKPISAERINEYIDEFKYIIEETAKKNTEKSNNKKQGIFWRLFRI